MSFNAQPYNEMNSYAPSKEPVPKIERPPLENELLSNLCCPSFLSCCLLTVFPCGWFGSCTQINEREELVLLNWGQYMGVLRQPGLYVINPFGVSHRSVSTAVQSMDIAAQKVLDIKGNPLRVSGVVTYEILQAKNATIDVNSWNSYLSTQAEVVLKQICSTHPYDDAKPGEDSLKREADKVRNEIKSLLQEKASIAGIKILNFEFKELSYAPEIAAQMLVKQQAEAMLEARKIVVEGAVTIAWDAIHHLKNAGIQLDNPEASRLASNLIVTICSESRVQPTINMQ